MILRIISCLHRSQRGRWRSCLAWLSLLELKNVNNECPPPFTQANTKWVMRSPEYCSAECFLPRAQRVQRERLFLIPQNATAIQSAIPNPHSAIVFFFPPCSLCPLIRSLPRTSPLRGQPSVGHPPRLPPFRLWSTHSNAK